MHRAVALIATTAVAALVACDTPSGPVFTFNRPANAEDVVVEFCTSRPAWIAVKEDSMDWQPLPLSAYGGARVTIPVTPRVGIAYGYVLLSDWVETHVIYLTAEELRSATCGPPTGTMSLTAPIAGVQPSDHVTVRIGGSVGLNLGSATSVRLNGIYPAFQDVVATRSISGQIGIDKMIVRHDFPAQPGQHFPTLKFDSSEAVTPAPVQMLAGNGDQSTLALSTGLFITNRGAVQPLRVVSVYPADSDVVYMPTPPQLAPGDGFSVLAATPPGRYATNYFTTPTPQTFNFGPALSTPTITLIDSLPVVRYRVQLPSQVEYPTLVRASFGAFFDHNFSVTVTAAYLGGTPTTWDITMPDFSKFLNNSVLLNGSPSTYTWSVDAWNTPIGQFFSPFGATDGLVVKCAMAVQPAASTFTTSGSCGQPYGFWRY